LEEGGGSSFGGGKRQQLRMREEAAGWTREEAALEDGGSELAAGSGDVGDVENLRLHIYILEKTGPENVRGTRRDLEIFYVPTQNPKTLYRAHVPSPFSNLFEAFR
jgi:hypothetical protein